MVINRQWRILLESWSHQRRSNTNVAPPLRLFLNCHFYSLYDQTGFHNFRRSSPKTLREGPKNAAEYVKIYWKINRFETLKRRRMFRCQFDSSDSQASDSHVVVTVETRLLCGMVCCAVGSGDLPTSRRLPASKNQHFETPFSFQLY